MAASIALYGEPKNTLAHKKGDVLPKSPTAIGAN